MHVMQNTNTVWKTQTVSEPTSYYDLEAFTFTPEKPTLLQETLNQLSKEGWTIFSVQILNPFVPESELDVLFLITAYKTEFPTLPKVPNQRMAVPDMIGQPAVTYH
jgi:predicted regulator of amino acid metabolism with ACT domain